MKIEKINDNQIKCTLSREDLTGRDLKMSELAYGTENAKRLFSDMMQKAAADFGFDAEDMPLMIEAIPLSAEDIILIITKVEAPDELDTRFSHFTPSNETDEREERERILPEGAEEAIGELSDLFCRIREKVREDSDEQESEKESEAPGVRLFKFDDMSRAIDAACSLGGIYQAENDIYRDEQKKCYHLLLRQGKHTTAEFRRIAHALSAYMQPCKYTAAQEAYFAEHLKPILSGKALQSLLQIG